MTADRKWMEQLGFALKHDERQGWLVIEDGADDRCATITERVLWDALLSLAAPVAPELDVTKILLNVVPGYEGEGLEIYAKSVDDVVALLTKQGERIEELESRVAAPVAPALERMRHIANEWADMATSGHQWLRNIIAGVSTPADALANSTLALQHCRKVNDAPATPPDTRKPCTCDGAGRGPGRECVVQACGRLGELWRCVKGNDGVKP